MEEQSSQPNPAEGLTKAQKYEQRRRVREETNRLQATSHSRVRYLRWAVLALVVIGGIYGLTKLPQAVSIPTTSGVLADAVTAGDWSRGNIASPVIFLEYGDFQCPACGSYYPITKQLEKDYGDRVRFVMRHFPLAQHQFALIAAKAAEAAGRQGKFWEMHDLLFANQTTWSNQAAALPTFTEYAQTLGLAGDRWKADLDLPEISDKISAQHASGARSGVNSTPTFFLNGKKMDQPRGYDDFKKAFDAALLAPSVTP